MTTLKSHFNNIFAITLALVVLISTNGISIYTHHCNTSQTNNYSLFIAASACEMDAPKPAVKSCCQPEIENFLEKCDTQSENNSCCTDQSKVFKLDTNTVLNHSTPSIKVTEMQSLMVFIAFQPVTLNAFHSIILTKNKNELPPPLSATEYLSYIQVYLI